MHRASPSDNLMYYAVDATSPTLTPQQRELLRRHPMVFPVDWRGDNAPASCGQHLAINLVE